MPCGPKPASSRGSPLHSLSGNKRALRNGSGSRPVLRGISSAPRLSLLRADLNLSASDRAALRPPTRDGKSEDVVGAARPGIRGIRGEETGLPVVSARACERGSFAADHERGDVDTL